MKVLCFECDGCPDPCFIALDPDARGISPSSVAIPGRCPFDSVQRSKPWHKGGELPQYEPVYYRCRGVYCQNGCVLVAKSGKKHIPGACPWDGEGYNWTQEKI
jgi:hypothetical protein